MEVIYLVLLFKICLLTKCPTSQRKWNNREKMSNCSYPQKYHCGRTVGDGKMEFCDDVRIIQPYECPIYDVSSNSVFLNTTSCLNLRCPHSSYFSNKIFRYPECFLNSTVSIKNESIKRTTEEAESFTLPLSTAQNSSINSSKSTSSCHMNFSNQTRPYVVETPSDFPVIPSDEMNIIAALLVISMLINVGALMIVLMTNNRSRHPTERRQALPKERDEGK